MATRGRAPNRHFRGRADLPWAKYASCQGVPTDVMFPTDKAGEEKALEICENCSVAMDCLEFALSEREEFGVWGGKSERERRGLRRKRARGKTKQGDRDGVERASGM